MANSFITANMIAQAALPILQDNLVAPALYNVDYSDTFQKAGDTIQVARPNVFTANEFSTTISAQDTNEQAMLMTLDTIADVSVELTSKELALNFADFQRQFIEPAITAISEKVNDDGLELYKYVGAYTGTSGSTPDALSDISLANANLNTARAPMMNRRGIWDPTATAKFQTLDALVGLDKTGSTAGLREGSIGRVFGIENYMSQAVKTHTAGGYTALADVTGTCDVSAANATDTTTGLTYSAVTLTSAAGTSTATLLKGDLLTIASKGYAVIETTASASSGVVTAKIYPALTADITDAAVTFPDVTARSHVANLAFNKNAFGFVARPLMPMAGYDSTFLSRNGLTLRVTIGSTISTKKTVMSIDTLYGYAPLYPELATRILG